MIIGVLPQSLSPGNEQHYYFGSKAASKKGSRNYAGVKSRAVDKLIDGIVSASDRRELINYTKCLDRVLLFGHYVIPHWHIDYIRVAYWDKFRMPKYTPMKGVDFMTWWAK
jgi:microcin C transport system substrate-binding protein